MNRESERERELRENERGRGGRENRESEQPC